MTVKRFRRFPSLRKILDEECSPLEEGLIVRCIRINSTCDYYQIVKEVEGQVYCNVCNNPKYKK